MIKNRVLSVAIALGLGASVLLGTAPAGATAAPCSVTDQQSGNSYSDLQTAINAASAGDTLQVTGTCVGNFTTAKDLTLLGSGGATLDGNRAGTTLTITAGMVSVVKMTITNGRASGDGSGNGSGIAVDTALILRRSTVTLNAAAHDGGGIFAGPSAVLTLKSSTVSWNEGNFGGGIFASSASKVTLRGSTLSRNQGDSEGGGIFSAGRLTVSHSTVTENGAGDGGGGIWSTGHLKLTDSTVSGNPAGSKNGGGIANFGGSGVITRTTNSGNYAHANGGGIWNTGTLRVTNSTLTANGFGEGGGGGIWNDGTITLINATVSGNRASPGAGIGNTGTASLEGTVLALNQETPDCFGSLSSGGYNLIGDATGCTFSSSTGDLVGPVSGTPIDPKLGPLADNGGPTQTMALLSGSPAIDVIPTAQCTAFLGPNPTDQRGVSRPQGTACDIGAFEVKV